MVLLCFLHLFFFAFWMQFWIIFASLGAFVVYDCVVEFYAAFSDKFMVSGCILPSDGFASA